MVEEQHQLFNLVHVVFEHTLTYTNGSVSQRKLLLHFKE